MGIGLLIIIAYTYVMRFALNICSFIFLVSCGGQPKIHLANLDKPTSSSSSKIILFKDNIGSHSSDPLHNIVPEHDSEESGHSFDLLYRLEKRTSCIEISIYSFCDEVDMLGARLKLYVLSKDLRIDDSPLGGGFQDILYRFLGSPTSSLYEVIQFSNKDFGLLHNYGFSFFHNGKFCQPIKTNPNGNMSFGLDSERNPLIYTTGTWTSADVPVDGWRVYDISKFCK